MKLTCPKHELLERVNLASKAVSGKTALKILECLLIIVDESGMYRLIGNDLAIGIETAPTQAERFEPGGVALDARLFSEIIRRAPEGNITITTDEKNAAVIRAGRYESRVPGSPADDFPFLTEVPKTSGYAVPSGALRDMIRRTIFSVATDDLKPVMTGELIEIADGSVRLVSVDGFRISVAQAPREPDGYRETTVIPAKTLSEVAKIIGGDDETVTVYFSDKHALFELGGCVVVTRLLEGEFLKYENLFTGDYKTLVTADRGELLDAVDRAGVIGKDAKKHPVLLSISDRSMVITSRAEMGDSRDEIDVEIDGAPIDIAFNPRFITEPLKVIDGERVTLSFQTPLTPCVIRGEADEMNKYLVLPLRV
ncbi:MAG: DNA polymerase III subunit beta [Clostridiales bacterium]|jgi:DNA polymerase-3 subunit beta|nr:DNA polymerase III subunit beta [Clostridiales bacterium]